MARFVDQTGRPGPATWQTGDYPEERDFPVSGISWYEAAAYAEFAGKSLPTGVHWDMARDEDTPLLRLGGLENFAPFSNFYGKGPVAVGSLPGITSYGAFDMAGNVRGVVLEQDPEGKIASGRRLGRSYLHVRQFKPGSPMDRSPKNGFRCAFYPSPEKIPNKFPDLYKQRPVADSVFQTYREQFSYDKTDLQARVEWRKENSEGWIQEKITFDAAYGGERVIAYLFLPRNTPPRTKLSFFSRVPRRPTADRARTLKPSTQVTFPSPSRMAARFSIPFIRGPSNAETTAWLPSLKSGESLISPRN